MEIPKKGGGLRPLGIPTVADRIGQRVVKELLEPVLDALFHEDSYGYRPGKSAIDAIAKARVRCWKQAWVIDLDIKGFFDNIPHDLLMNALRSPYPRSSAKRITTFGFLFFGEVFLYSFCALAVLPIIKK
jgi:RNA-directed DNA polymerase